MLGVCVRACGPLAPASICTTPTTRLAGTHQRSARPTATGAQVLLPAYAERAIAPRACSRHASLPQVNVSRVWHWASPLWALKNFATCARARHGVACTRGGSCACGCPRHRATQLLVPSPHKHTQGATACWRHVCYACACTVRAPRHHVIAHSARTGGKRGRAAHLQKRGGGDRLWVRPHQVHVRAPPSVKPRLGLQLERGGIELGQHLARRRGLAARRGAALAVGALGGDEALDLVAHVGAPWTAASTRYVCAPDQTSRSDALSFEGSERFKAPLQAKGGTHMQCAAAAAWLGVARVLVLLHTHG